MGAEWSNKSKYNSFNSYKGLTYYAQYQRFIGWLRKQNPLPYPIEVSLDPINACNQDCYYCNSQRYLSSGIKKWDKSYMYDLLVNIAQRGAKAFCWGGGGEALLNDNIRGMTELGIRLGMEASIITNGTLLNKFEDELLLCRWVGISLDSAEPVVYEKIRGTGDCHKVLQNIRSFAKKRTTTDIAVKVLLLPETADTIAYTCELVKALGVQDFHVRPVDLERKDYKGKSDVVKHKDMVKRVFDKCHKMETKDFHVYTVTHKYDDDFKVKHEFDKCYASPLVMQICTDKKMYVCVDHRMEPRFEIKEWGSDQHRDLLLNIDPCKECSRCTWGEYNRQVTDVVLGDKMCRNFP